MVFPRQRLIQDTEKIPQVCRNCLGRGFLLLEKASPTGKIEPNEVIECGVCDGTGKQKYANTDQA